MDPISPLPPDLRVPSLGVGILSWRGYTSLRRTLESYRARNFFDLFDEKVLFLPEMEDEGRSIGRDFGLTCAGDPKNLGIMGGFEALARAMTSDYILLLENDFALIEGHDEAASQIARAVAALRMGEAQMWRFRHRHHPGEPWQIDKVQRYWPSVGAPWKMAALRRFLRPRKALRFIGSTVFYRDDGPDRFSLVMRRTDAGDFLVRSDVLNWSNNPFLIKRDFFLNTILKAAHENPQRRLVNGLPTLEIELNSPWWKAQKFWIGISNPGLFTHARENDRGY